MQQDDPVGAKCSVCGGRNFVYRQILWQALIDEWQLSADETYYINRQQGKSCTDCGSNLRSMALADAICSILDTSDTLRAFCASPAASSLKVLELNEAGSLHPVLRQLPLHVFGAYPDVDMHALPFADGTFDIVLHSDTLEHVPNPVHALGECRRVLRPGGALCYTVPVVIGRMSRDRTGLPKSYHGNPAETGDDYSVHTEFGADAWVYPCVPASPAASLRKGTPGGTRHSGARLDLFLQANVWRRDGGRPAAVIEQRQAASRRQKLASRDKSVLAMLRLS